MIKILIQKLYTPLSKNIKSIVIKASERNNLYLITSSNFTFQVMLNGHK